MRAWLTDPEFKAFLHRYDGETGDQGKSAPRRKVAG